MPGPHLKILVLPLYGIGDVLMTTPALRNIKERLGASVTYLHMFKTTRDILIGNPHVDENIHFPFLDSGKVKNARFMLGFRGKYDVSINFYPSNRRDYNLASFIAGSPLRIGHRYRVHDLRELNFLKNRTFPEDDSLHNVEENLRLLSFLGVKDPISYPMEIYFSREEEGAAAQWLKERGIQAGGIIGFHPGTSVFKSHARKRWAPEKFAALIDRLSALYPGYKFLLFGGPEEASLKKEIKGKCASGDRVLEVNLPGIRQTASVMKSCALFITNDSGLMHLSAALQVPTVAIFGPTNPKWLFPWKCPSRVVRFDNGCAPCFRYSPVPMRCGAGQDFSCIEKIDVRDVLEAAASLLN